MFPPAIMMNVVPMCVHYANIYQELISRRDYHRQYRQLASESRCIFRLGGVGCQNEQVVLGCMSSGS